MKEAIRSLRRYRIRAVARNGILVDGSSVEECRKMAAAEKLRRVALMMHALPRREDTPEEAAELERVRARWVKLKEAFERREKNRA